MTSRDFVYWLQGYFEILAASPNDTEIRLTRDQINCVRKHLNLVFKHEIDPSMGDEKHQEELNAIHNEVEFPKPYESTPVGKRPRC